MMFLSSFINAKVNLIAGMAIGVGMAIILREMCKKKGQLATRNTATRNEASE
jgi:mannose/fructose/N-acetylgalactosamine-specific phosphotransferase system component IIC